MNYIDAQYLDLLKDIIENGVRKNTRAGEVLSVFGRSMRFNLRDGLPLLTTKKVFTKGIIHELIWFLKGDTNIKYLIDNNVNIWTDDAYRYYTELVAKHNKVVAHELSRDFYKIQPIDVVSKEEFIKRVGLQQKELFILNENNYIMSFIPNSYAMDYTYGDLGAVYGKQWRGGNAKSENKFTFSKIDQIQMIIDKLKNNPDDRRILCDAYSPMDIYSDYGVALPPCHMFFQFWTREMKVDERAEWYFEHSDEDIIRLADVDEKWLDERNVPKRALSCMYYMRSNDYMCGQPYNSPSYAILTYIIANICNMVPDELIFNGGDVHIYANHLEGAKEQLSRNGSDVIPQFHIKRQLTSIDDLKYEDFEITDYYPDAPIKFQLNVG